MRQPETRSEELLRVGWNFAGAWRGPDGDDYLDGRRTGYADDHGHAGLVVNRSAREGVWPLTARWLTERAESTEEPGGER